MKILWLCNVVLSEFCEEFGLNKTVVGGWMSGMFTQLKESTDLDIAFCFPIIDKKRLKNGIFNGYRYYSFVCNFNEFEYKEETVEKFIHIVREVEPDVIHIWGTEYPHASAMLDACTKLGLVNRVVAHLQGLVSVYAEHYLRDIPIDFCSMKIDNLPTLYEENEEFRIRGILEQKFLKKIQHVIGRTNWDRACVAVINNKINYHFCNETLRDTFYKQMKTWDIEQCVRHSIFVSQSVYPVKGMHFLMKALAIVHKNYPDVHVYVGGVNIMNAPTPGPYAIYLKTLEQEYELEDKITFLGKLTVDEMSKNYQKANVFVLPSTIENSPNSLCEAMMIGTPVVSSYVGGVDSFIRHGENGYLYQQDAPYMLAYYIEKIFENKEEAERISRLATDSISKINNGYNNAMRLNDIYKEIIINGKDE